MQTVTLGYSAWKVRRAELSLPMFHIKLLTGDGADTRGYNLFAAKDEFILQSKVDAGTDEFTDWETWLLPTSTEVGSENEVAAAVSQPAPLDAEGNQRTVMLPTPGTEKNFYAPNMCDRCSWYAGSAAVVEQVLTDSGDHTAYTSPDVFWIDLKHGRLFKEDDVLADDPTLAVTVEVQYGGTGAWVEVVENSWGLEDGDYSVDYEAGSIAFNEALIAADNVRASYHKKDKYEFYVQPTTGKRLKIVYAEVQYCTDIVFNRGVSFTIEVYNPAPPPTRVPYKGYTFKTLRDFYVESTGPFPVIPPHGGGWETVEITGIGLIEAAQDAGYEVLGTRHDGDDWVALMRGLVQNGGREVRFPLLTIPFNYNAFIELKDSIGTRIKITLQDDEPFGGSFGNITFYCLTEDE